MFTYREATTTTGLPSGWGLPIKFDEGTYSKSVFRDGPATNPTPEELLLRAFVARDLAPTTICDLLNIDVEELDRRLLFWGLPKTRDRQARKCGKNAWSPADSRALVRCWKHNYTPRLIASLISRSVAAVSAKARRLGLYARDRKALVCEAPVWEPLDARKDPSKNKRVRLPNEILRQIRDRWVRGQSAEGIVMDLGLDMTGAALSTKAHRIGLPPRVGKVTVTYDATTTPDPRLVVNCVEIVCAISKAIFFGNRLQKWSPTSRNSATFRHLANADSYGFA